MRTTEGGQILAAPGSTNALKRSGLIRAHLGEGLSTVIRCPTVFGALMAKAEACVRIHESPSRRLRHQQDIVTLAAALATEGYEDDRTAKERRTFFEATAPLVDDVTHEAWFGASSDVREVLRLIRG